ncbi:MAG: hypothetical protein HKN26_05045, partial [Acidimicrobiales bacterium]|nr:hypothetical protein [Acidimicrobiales bacterium]
PTTSVAQTRATSTTTAPEFDPETEAAVLEAYLEAQQIFFDALTQPNELDLDSIRGVRSGDALAQLERVAAELSAEGSRLAFPSESEFLNTGSVVEIDGDRATVVGCLIDDSFAIAPDGTRTDEALAAQSWSAALLRDAGVWRVGQLSLIARIEGATTCAD